MTATTPPPEDRLAYSLQFVHLDKLYARLPGLDDATLAAAWGTAPGTLQRIRERFAASAEAAARELLAEPAFAAQLAAWPMAPGSTLAAVGDSLTDDWQSWFAILGHVLRLGRAADRLQLVNAGYSGDTTADAVSRFLRVVPLKPDWIVAAIGTNDARRHGRQAARGMVSPAETRANLETLRRLGAEQAPQARWIWMTPGRVIEARMLVHWYLAPGQVWLRNADLDAVAAILRERPEPVIDLQQVFAPPVAPEVLLDDGLHPSIEGHKAIVRAVVARFSALNSSPEP